MAAVLTVVNNSTAVSTEWLLQTSIYHECERVGHEKENA